MFLATPTLEKCVLKAIELSIPYFPCLAYSLVDKIQVISIGLAVRVLHYVMLWGVKRRVWPVGQVPVFPANVLRSERNLQYTEWHLEMDSYTEADRGQRQKRYTDNDKGSDCKCECEWEVKQELTKGEQGATECVGRGREVGSPRGRGERKYHRHTRHCMDEC